ncbi:SusC/RagA family TonB-linked outer membrane protein [Flavobacterium sp. ARAG 55.4]|uniref:SusC/RagA family TonB-linked outer membrane protein n=1 Tax=Flavobacterium sp. ARAG 55.4 TaxID=3451357 RepID=UPI003F46D2C0
MNALNKKYYFILLGILFYLPMLGQQTTITGVVKDAKTGMPLPGVTVLIKSTTQGTSTDLDGNYSIKVDSKGILQFSYIGYKTSESPVIGKTTINISLTEESNQLDEIVVIGYGTSKRKDLTGSVASVTSEEINRAPVANVAQALQGKLAGVNVVAQDGRPGANISIRVRGGGSISQSNEPLYIVDGFPVSTISNIPGSQILSIDVLKDASSTAIYGARGANGVIMVTTKSGKSGKTKITYDGYTQFNTPTGYLPVMKGYDYIKYNWAYAQAIGDGYANAWEKLWLIGNEFNGSNSDGIDYYKTVKSEDFSKKVYNSSFSHNHDFNISSGNDKTKYLFSINHIDQEGMKLNTSYKRSNVLFKLDQKLGDKINFNLNTRYSQEETIGNEGTSSGGGSLLTSAYWFRPIAKNDILGESDVTINTQLGDYENLLNDLYSPVNRINDYTDKDISNSLVANASLDWEIIKGLTAKTNLGLNTGWGRRKIWQGAIYQRYIDSEGNKTFSGDASINATQGWNYRWVNTLNYQVQGLGDNHSLTVLGGMEVADSGSESTYVFGRRYPVSFDADRAYANMDSYDRSDSKYGGFTSDTGTPNRLNSYFGRANYSFMDKYLFTATFRADGSSRFAPSNRWGYFPAGAFAWRVSDENFLKNVNWLSSLKMRVSYGTVGSDGINSGLWKMRWESSGLTGYSLNETQQLGYVPASTLNNPNLKWETTITRNIGLDFSLFNNKITGTIDVYKNTVKDLLLLRPIPPISGFSAMYDNIGATSNKGIEISLSGAIVKAKDFNLHGSVNININKGNIDKLGEGINPAYSSAWGGINNSPASGDYIFEVGKPVGLVRGWIYEGWYTTNDFDYNAGGAGTYTLKSGIPDIASGYLSTVYGTTEHKPNSQTAYPGVPKYKDLNGDGIINDDDLTVIGNMNPKHTGGFNLSGNYKNFDFGLDFNWSYGNDIYNANHLNAYQGNKESGLFRNRLQELAGAYKIYDVINGQITPVVAPADLDALNAKTTTFIPFAEKTMTSTYAIEDGSFLRLNTFTLGYSLPETFLSKIGLNSLRVYGTIYNVFTLTGYNGLDPEVNPDPSRNGDYPTPGLDYGSYPRPRSFTFGVNVEF